MRTILRATLTLAALVLSCLPSMAQVAGQGFDLSGMGTPNNTLPGNVVFQPTVTEITTVTNTPFQMGVSPNGTMVSDPQLVPGTYRNNNGAANGTSTIMNVLGNTTQATGKNNVQLFDSSQALLAPGSWFGETAIPTGDSLGFPSGAPKIYKGVSGFKYGGILMPTSTAEVILNVVE